MRVQRTRWRRNKIIMRLHVLLVPPSTNSRQTRFVVIAMTAFFVQFSVFASPGYGVDSNQTPTVAKFISDNCVICHGPLKQKGKLRLDTLQINFDDAAALRVWVKVMDKLNLGEMPPEEKPADALAQLQLVKWIAAELRTVHRKSLGADGRMMLRRLNRAEYPEHRSRSARPDVSSRRKPARISSAGREGRWI